MQTGPESRCGIFTAGSVEKQRQRGNVGGAYSICSVKAQAHSTQLQQSCDRLVCPTLQTSVQPLRTSSRACWTRTRRPALGGRNFHSTHSGRSPCPKLPCLSSRSWRPSLQSMAWPHAHRAPRATRLLTTSHAAPFKAAGSCVSFGAHASCQGCERLQHSQHFDLSSLWCRVTVSTCRVFQLAARVTCCA